MARQRKWAWAGWATRDAYWASAYVFLLLLAYRFPVLLYVAFAVPPLLGAALLVRRRRRMAEWKRNPHDFWVDRIR